jgi:hypothetical protein
MATPMISPIENNSNSNIFFLIIIKEYK